MTGITQFMVVQGQAGGTGHHSQYFPHYCKGHQPGRCVPPGAVVQGTITLF